MGITLSSIFLLVGLTLLLVGVYLKRQSLKLQKAIASLYDLNQQVNQDVIAFLSQTWLILAPFGFKSYAYRLVWYGEVIESSQGTPADQTYQIQFKEEGIQLEIELTSNKVRGEVKMVLEMVLQTLKMLIALNISNKAKQFLFSQKRLEDYQLFVQHDMKNIAQFISLLESQVVRTSSDEEKIALVNQLKNLVPSIALRAHKVMEPLPLKGQDFLDVAELDLQQELSRLSKAVMVPLSIDGEGQLSISKNLFNQVFVNLLENFKAHQNNLTQVSVRIENQSEQIKVCLSSERSTTDQKIDVERVFEPFWTTSQSGLGLGLFIVRALLNKVEGSVAFFQTDNQVGYEVFLSKEQKETV